MNDDIIHIQGDNDKILPLKNIRSVDFKIENGGHLMILNKSNEINELFKKFLSKVSE